MNTAQRIACLTTIISGSIVLVGCGDSAPNASSMGAETPLEAAQIYVNAVADEDWGTLCAHLRDEEARDIATYWTSGEDTCADNVDSVIGSEYRDRPDWWSSPNSVDLASAEIDDRDSDVILDFGEEYIRVVPVDGLGYQIAGIM